MKPLPRSEASMTLESILRKGQKELKRALTRELKEMRYEPVVSKGFVYAAGTVPVLLVAHMDTVHQDNVKLICYSRDGNVIMSPQGIGGDDRAGIYMILQLLKTHHCHVLFCEDEECGGIGAKCFASSGIIPDVNYIVELDRRGSQDAVFYDCDNPEFTEFVCSFGFVQDEGSFSDISIIAPALGRAAVNISSGYYNEHTRHETIDLRDVQRNILRLRAMLSAKVEQFEYVERFWPFDGYSYPYKLMPLSPDDYIVSSEGETTEAYTGMLMDEFGTAYEMIEEGIAIRFEGTRVYNKEAMPAKFNAKKASFYDVFPEEFAYM